MESLKFCISIVMPVYNVERYLPQCMDSIFAQTLKDIEVIAVNDGSTDQSLKILEKYRQAYPDRMRIFTIDNNGVSHARNYGLARAEGEYVLFVDSDDFLETEMCEKLYRKAKADNNDLVICGRYNVYENERLGQYRKESAGTQLISRNFRLKDCSFELAHISPFPWDKLFRRSLLEGILFPEKLRFEDLVFSYEAACKAEWIGVVEEPLYNYRRTRQGGFLNSLTEQTLDIIKSFGILFDYMKAGGYMEAYYEELEYICARHFLFRYGSLFKVENKGKLALKKRIIRETQDYLDRQLPGWRKNRYLRYSAAPELKMKLKLYTKKSRLLKMAVLREYLPYKMIKLLRGLRNSAGAWKRRLQKLRAANQKLELIRKKLPFLSLWRKNGPSVYVKLYRRLSVKPQEILLESKHGEDLAGNIFALLREFGKEQYQEFHVSLVLVPELMEKYRTLLDRYGIGGVSLIKFRSRQYLRALATAKYLITDTSFPTYYIKKSSQVLLNTWHGTPLKAMGRAVPMREYGLGNVQRNFLISDYLLYQNEFSRDMFLRDYMLDKVYPGTILTCGYPRNSVFFDQARYGGIREEAGLGGKQIIVYMPTWRGLLTEKENDKQIKDLQEYFTVIDEGLREDQIFYVKLHPYVKEQLRCSDYLHIREFPKEYETYDFLNACDILVTDYSSIMFDFGVTKRKIILFIYDRAEYLADRGLYLDLEELELPKAENARELIAEINRENRPYPKFWERFCSYDSPETPQKVCEQLLYGKAGSGISAGRVMEGLLTESEIAVAVRGIADSSEEIAAAGRGRTETAENAKKTVLIVINGMKCNDNARRLIDNINSIDTDRYEVFVCAKADKLKNATRMLSGLRKEIGYFPISYNVDYTRWEYIKCLFLLRFGLRMGFSGRCLREVADREIEKYFGSLRFDIAIHHSEEDYLLALLCRRIATTSIYNMKFFNYNHYKDSGKYRGSIKRSYRLLRTYDAVIATNEFKKLKLAADNILISEDSIFPMSKILKEVDR